MEMCRFYGKADAGYQKFKSALESILEFIEESKAERAGKYVMASHDGLNLN